MKNPQRGAVAVEFALVSSVFFLLLFGVVDFGYLMWVNLTMQHAVREGARYAITGRMDLDPEPDPTNTAQNRYDAALAEMKSQSMGLWDQVNPQIAMQAIDAAGELTDLPENSTGQPEQILIIRLRCTAHALTPLLTPFLDDGVFRFDVSATMKNEAYR